MGAALPSAFPELSNAASLDSAELGTHVMLVLVFDIRTRLLQHACHQDTPRPVS